MLKHPFTALVSGPTQSGKTVLTKAIVKHAQSLITPPPKQIIWCYNEWQPAYEEMTTWANITLVQGIPEICPSDPQLIIFDDMMLELKSDPRLMLMFTRKCHHGNYSCIQLTQNLFFGGRTSRVNAQYIFLMKNPSDKLQTQMLGRQLFPSKLSYFKEAYDDACAKAHGYLLLDLHQSTADHLRLRTKILPGELQVVYCPK